MGDAASQSLAYLTLSQTSKKVGSEEVSGVSVVQKIKSKAPFEPPPHLRLSEML